MDFPEPRHPSGAEYGGPPDRGPGRALLETAAADGALVALLHLLSADLGCPCWVLSVVGRTVAGTRPLPDGADQTLAEEFTASGAKYCVTTAAGRTFELCRLATGGAYPPLWFLAVEGRAERGLSEAADRLGAAAHLDASRHEGCEHGRRRSAAQLLSRLWRGERASRELHALLAACGLDPRAPLVAFALRASGPDAPSFAQRFVDEAIGSYAEAVATAPFGDHLISLARVRPGTGHEAHGRLRTAARLTGRSLSEHRISVGASSGDTHSLGPGEALAEARHALRSAELLPGPISVVVGAEAGTADLLIASAPGDTRYRFHRDALGSLEDYDAHHNSALVMTLETLLAHSGSWQRCAAELHIHVNTVRYRLRRIQELTGRDLARFTDRVDLYLALRITAWERGNGGDDGLSFAGM